MKTIGSQSFDQKLKRFFFMHWEKIVLALAFVGIGAFCWFGYVKPYDKTTPSQLKQNVETAKRYIQDNQSWTQIANYRKAVDDSAEVISNEQKINDAPFQYTRLLGSKAATRGLRTDPEIKQPMNPQAKVVTGTILVQRPMDTPGVRREDWWTRLIRVRRSTTRASADVSDGAEGEEAGLGRGMRGSRPVNSEKKSEILVVPDLMTVEFRGLSPSRLGLKNDEHTSLVVSAVAVTGLFPHELQVREFENKLKDAIKYNELRDQPYYVYLQVERKRRSNGQETEWEDISKYVTEDLLKNVYAATAPEIVEEPYVDKFLTVKIPPFVWMDYKWFSAAEGTPVIVEKVETTSEAVAVTSKEGIQLTDFNVTEAAPVAEVTEVDADKLAQYKLIRFFDMSLQPNEEAQYRFRVWIADPNNPKPEVYNRIWNQRQLDAATGQSGQTGDAEGTSGAGGLRGGTRGSRQGGGEDMFANAGNPFDLTFMDLDKGVRDRLKALETQPAYPAPLEFLKDARPSEWSEPTEWIRIPKANSEIIAGRVEPGMQLNVNGVVFSDDEPQVNVVVKKWDPALHVQVPVARKVYRGSVMNFRSAAKVVNPIDRQLYDVTRELIEPGEEENGVKFNTNAFVVDMDGGQKMPYSTLDKAYYRPSEILVMNEDGTLEVRNELADRMEYRHGTFADDESLTDVAPKPEVEEETDDQDEGGMGRGGRSGRGGRGAR